MRFNGLRGVLFGFGEEAFEGNDLEMSVPTGYEVQFRERGAGMRGEGGITRSLDPVRVKTLFCDPQVLSIRDFWATILHRDVIGYVCVLGVFLGALTSGLVYYGGFRWIHVPLYVLVIPILATLISATIIIIYQFFLARFISRNVSIYWFTAMLPALFLVDLLFGLIRVIAEGVPLLSQGNLILPVVVWTVIAEGMTIFAVKFLIEPRQEKERWIAGVVDENGTVRPSRNLPAQEGNCEDQTVQIGEHLFDLNEPLILEAQGNYVLATSADNTVLARGPLSTFLDTIDERKGLRIHRSFWVTFSACEGLDREGPELYLDTRLGHRLKIARPRQSEISELLATNGIVKKPVAKRA